MQSSRRTNCGCCAAVGTIGLSVLAAGKCSSLLCTEVEGSGKAAFEASLAALRQHHAQGAGAGAAASYQVTNAAALSKQQLSQADVIIVDPPRKGLEAALIATLCGERPPATTEAGCSSTQRSAFPGHRLPRAGMQDQRAQAQRLIYLSCGLPALMRDLAYLLQSGRWRVTHAEGFVFFPGADAVETLVVLDAK